MNYALQTLKQELTLIEKIVSNWDEKFYPEAYKDRLRKINDLKKAIDKIENKFDK